MKRKVPPRIKQVAKKLLFPTPSHLRKNQIPISRQGLDVIEKSIRENYHTGWRSESNYSKEMYENDLNAHLHRRLESDRLTIMPWLDNAGALRDRRILEIGCGTGSSTVAIAEQGGDVVGIDIDEGALDVARDRCRVYGVNAEFRALNADEVLETFGANAFDVVIFFACLEHMTVAERLSSLRDAWEALRTQGLLIIVETPNRLWYFDDHTAMLPFFHWLPDELAFQYSRFSPRANFRELYREYSADWKEHFLRRGRGMSFHELEVAICPARELRVISSLSTFEGVRYRLKTSKLDRNYKSLMMRIYPDIHEGFFDNMLYLIIEKK
jgi:2-polyprenyl-3-methyl-5-hydroxy-6-metoxy-1,4-benzoquinol methylase